MFFVRTAMEKDLPPVRDLLQASFHAAYVAILGEDAVNEIVAGLYSPAALQVLFESKASEFLVADDGKRLGGMVYGAPDKGSATTVNLGLLYVHPDFQRQGIGRDLFAEIETCFPDAKRLAAEVPSGNNQALQFLQAHGLHEVDRLCESDVSNSTMTVVVMQKELAGV